ncbi:cytochrome c oxidase assembly protein subunit 15 [Brevundimonas bullata]|uniref:Heme A synthase n=1 Tax=Brevundimonas bullata TaxID=13160 RepID=A0A7W7IS17_9CAUL|nr:COX15/CtaA family protein [Brevundimonas bullata]MBB4799484.1 cytochrome c oxidase assembly protein subunit 15 [Brevundimonas bullata]MBB6384445.1 cytochrome c oxidase assembly protein subunit 15 [Brevundimonas bullata]
MKRFGNQDQSRAVALWLFFSAAMVFAMVVIGGVTRLTGSGLSITEWKPIMGAIPPLNAAEWAQAFDKYKAIPQYAQVNAGMSLGEFQGIFWWEWLHRLFGRLIGVVFAVPFVIFLVMRRMPQRLIGRCLILLALGGLQGLIGWWMVSSGLSERVDVAPERLATHLGLAFLIFAGLIWTGLEAWSGSDHSRSPRGWTWGAGLLLGAIFVQCLLGGLVAGAKAGFVFTDWPMMNGAVFPPVEWSMGGLAFLHDHGLVQFNHRLGAYLLLAGGTAYAIHAWRWRLAEGLGLSAFVLAGALWLQAGLGVVTLMHAVPITLGALHQAVAALVLGAATINLWLVRRSRPRLFMSGPRSTVL